jgi:hypothetical protein
MVCVCVCVCVRVCVCVCVYVCVRGCICICMPCELLLFLEMLLEKEWPSWMNCWKFRDFL